MIDIDGKPLFKPVIETEKDFFSELRDLNTPENPCDYFVVAAFRNGTAGVYSTAVDPVLIGKAFEFGIGAVADKVVGDEVSVDV